MRVEIDNKYTIIFEQEPFRFEALRGGKSWRDLTGDKLILAMAQRIEELEKQLLERDRDIYHLDKALYKAKEGDYPTVGKVITYPEDDGEHGDAG